MNVQYDYTLLCKTVLENVLDRYGLSYNLISTGEITITSQLTPEQQSELEQTLKAYGITILKNTQDILVQRIKDAITELLHDHTKNRTYNVSTYLAETLNYSYSHLSAVFSESTHTSIENFVILRKSDVAKQLIIEDQLTLTEIAFKLNYSSVAHLSAQFKKTTGLTPSQFKRIIKKRKTQTIRS